MFSASAKVVADVIHIHQLCYAHCSASCGLCPPQRTRSNRTLYGARHESMCSIPCKKYNLQHDSDEAAVSKVAPWPRSPRHTICRHAIKGIRLHITLHDATYRWVDACAAAAVQVRAVGHVTRLMCHIRMHHRRSRPLPAPIKAVLHVHEHGACKAEGREGVHELAMARCIRSTQPSSHPAASSSTSSKPPKAALQMLTRREHPVGNDDEDRALHRCCQSAEI